MALAMSRPIKIKGVHYLPCKVPENPVAAVDRQRIMRSFRTKDPLTSLPTLLALREREHLANVRAAKTGYDFTHRLERLCKFSKKDSAANLTKQDLIPWVDHLWHDGRLAPRTVRDRYLAAVKSVLQIGVDTGMLPS